MKHWELSDIGKLRKENQDSFQVFEYKAGEEQRIITVAMVCDGMGGAKGGAIASKLTVEQIAERIKAQKPDMTEARSILSEAVALANHGVFERSQKDSECSGMGTTLVAVLTDGERAIVANVGDSRCYIIRDNSIEQLTKDHSLVEGLVDSGEITREEARSHPKRNIITRAVGVYEHVECDFYETELHDSCELLLCSDGLSGVVEDREMLFEIAQTKQTETAVSRMVNLALERGAPDNITAILLTTELH